MNSRYNFDNSLSFPGDFARQQKPNPILCVCVFVCVFHSSPLAIIDNDNYNFLARRFARLAARPLEGERLACRFRCDFTLYCIRPRESRWAKICPCSAKQPDFIYHFISRALSFLRKIWIFQNVCDFPSDFRHLGLAIKSAI